MIRLARLALPLLVALASGCASLPPLDGRTDSRAIRETADTKLGKAIMPLAARNGARPTDQSVYREPGKPVMAGLHALPGGREALAARVVLADAAEATLDIQYYYWRGDRSGTFMFNAIRRAADRGVRVRLLLDDGNTAGQDPILRALDRHPMIEVRLFNPFAQRNGRLAGYLSDFERLNRRMHNKSFTADNQATIIGGRNIGDDYFDATDDRAFADLDVLAVGAIVDQVSTDFDRYWSSESAYPVDRLLRSATDDLMAGLMGEVEQAQTGPAYRDYAEAVQNTVFLRDLFGGNLKLDWAMTRIVSDDPAKVLNKAARSPSLPDKMRELIGNPRQLLEMVSPYFVPMQDGLDYLASLEAQGVQVRVLTNSLAATDVVAVHSGYARWRKPLLQAGIELHEYKPVARTPGSGGTARSGAPAAGGGGRDRGAGGVVGSGSGQASAGSVAALGSGATRGSGESPRSSLHAKTYSVDRSRVVIGSFNFDPRSSDLNTELSVVIDSPALASSVDEAYSRNVPNTAWQLALTDAGDLQWIETEDGRRIVHDNEPAANFWRRVGAAVIGLLPIDWLL
jgi:putative cardiolipin synthase